MTNDIRVKCARCKGIYALCFLKNNIETGVYECIDTEGCDHRIIEVAAMDTPNPKPPPPPTTTDWEAMFNVFESQFPDGDYAEFRIRVRGIITHLINAVEALEKQMATKEPMPLRVSEPDRFEKALGEMVERDMALMTDKPPEVTLPDWLVDNIVVHLGLYSVGDARPGADQIISDIKARR